MAYDVSKIANLLLRFAYNADGNEDLMSNMKLQKMLYYQQGFHLAYFGTPLFEDEIEAWMYGPVVPSVYYKYESSGRNGIEPDLDDEFEIKDKRELALFNQVFSIYGKYSAFGLMDMTHKETPWASTPTGKGNVIPKEKMRKFFKNLIQ